MPYKAGDEFFEYDCPNSNIDFDIEPPPAYGAAIECSACGKTHVATETLGVVHRFVPDGEDGLKLIDVTDEWKSRNA